MQKKETINIALDNKYIIDTNELMAGDIIFSTTFEYISTAIKFFTNSEFSHVMLYVDDNSIIHADADGVHAYNTQRILFDDKNHCAVYRLRDPISVENLNTIIKYVRSLIGCPYSVIEAMLTKVYKGNAKSKKLFCSRLVAQAFSQANINLVSSIDYCSPEDIRQSNHLEIVTNPLRKLTELDKKRILETKDKPAIQTEITNNLFSKISKLAFKEISNFQSLIDFLILENKFDTKISEILRESGYLTMWVNELNDNAILYDKELYDNFVSVEEKQSLQASSSETYKRYKQEHNNYLDLYKKYKLRVFKDLLTLYSIIARNEQLRLKVLNKIELDNEETDTFFPFIHFLVKLFFIAKGLNNITKEQSYDHEYYQFIYKHIGVLVNSFTKIQNLLKKFNMENDFIMIDNYLKEIYTMLNDIIYIEMRKRRNPENCYRQLRSKSVTLTEYIDKINYTSIFE